MNIWNVGDKATHSGVECTVVAIHTHSAAIQYSRTGGLEIVPLINLRPDFSEDEKKAIEDILQIICAEDDAHYAAEALYLAGYRKREETPTKGMDYPANWKVGDWVECIEVEDKYVTLGKTYQIEGFSDGTRLFTLRDDEGDMGSYTSACFKFHRDGDEK